MKLFVVVGPIVPADDDAGTNRGTGKEHDDHVDDAGGGTNGGESMGADKVSNNETVHSVV